MSEQQRQAGALPPTQRQQAQQEQPARQGEPPQLRDERAERAETAVEAAEDVALDGLLDEERAELAAGASRMDAATRHALLLRASNRRNIREFLRAVPRSETETTLTLVRPDGSARLITRAQLSTAIDRLRPRQRQIIRLGLEERWSRPRICAYLHNISVKTLERDQTEALDILAQL